MDDAPRDLSAVQCRERLLASSHGYLAGTHRALPLVVPVDIGCVDDEIFLLVHDRHLRGPLPGHVVALAVGEPARQPVRGWTVVACGRIGAAAPDGSSAFALEMGVIQGWVFDGPPTDLWSAADPLLLLEPVVASVRQPES